MSVGFLFTSGMKPIWISSYNRCTFLKTEKEILWRHWENSNSLTYFLICFFSRFRAFTHTQIQVINSNIKLAANFLQRCPSCFSNFARQICDMTCAPNQSSFMRIQGTDKGVDGKLITNHSIFIRTNYREQRNISMESDKLSFSDRIKSYTLFYLRNVCWKLCVAHKIFLAESTCTKPTSNVIQSGHS